MRLQLPQTWQEAIKFTGQPAESGASTKRISVDCEGEGS